MELLEIYGTDKEKQLEGVWKTLVPKGGGNPACRIKVARIGNSRYQEVLSKLLLEEKETSGSSAVSEEAKTLILVKAMAKTILLAWENIQFEGKDIHYSEANCIKLLSDERLSDFRDLVTGISNTLENYRLDNIGDISGKS